MSDDASSSGKRVSEPGLDSEPKLERYLVDLFPSASECKNGCGSYLKVSWDEDSLGDACSNLRSYERSLHQRLVLIDGIGPVTQRAMRRRGTKSLRDVAHSYPQFGVQARKLDAMIRGREVTKLAWVRNCRDIDLLYAFKREELLFLDVEGLGFYGSPLFLVGLGFFDKGGFSIRQLLARDYSEEEAVCRAFLDILPRFRCLVSFNGKTYDASVLRDRCQYYFEEDPFGPGGVDAKQGGQTPPFPSGRYHHIDLYHNSRRAFRGRTGPSGPLTDFRLGTIEQEVLGLSHCRDGGIPSYRVPRLYEEFVESPAEHVDDMKKVVTHNFHDVRNLVVLLDALAAELLSGGG
ncbi:MAG: ribonuclease H-like domain-containing protein [Promethearchaeota archaeon]